MLSVSASHCLIDSATTRTFTSSLTTISRSRNAEADEDREEEEDRAEEGVGGDAEERTAARGDDADERGEAHPPTISPPSTTSTIAASGQWTVTGRSCSDASDGDPLSASPPSCCTTEHAGALKQRQLCLYL